MDLFRLIVPSIEILIIAIIIYTLFSFFWNTRAMDLVLGLLAFLSVFAFSNWFHLPVLQKLMLYFVNVAVIALLIIFQPELRLALSKLSVKGKKYREITEFDKFLESLSQSIYRFSEKRIGALVILENQDSLEEFANKAVLLNAQYSPELLESIFTTATPLHDGAVIIRGTTILSAATILPLADDSSQLSKSMGTRHRAGLGISQLTDALIIVVSEETGKVSIARDGIMTRGIKVDRFKGIVRSIFTPPKTTIESSIDALGRLKQWKR
jgi:diadenylate cyclase